MSSPRDLLRRILAGDFGFTMDETMTGEHHFEPGQGPDGPHPFEFVVTWGPKRLRPPTIGPGGTLLCPLAGHVTAGNLCTQAPCQGTLQIDYFKTHTIRYQFDFQANGQDYRYTGTKVNIRPWNLPTSHTTCFGTLTQQPQGLLVSTSLTHFPLTTLPTFLLSLRPNP